MLFNKTRQYNIQNIDKIFFFKYRTRQIKTRETNKKVTCLKWNVNDVKCIIWAYDEKTNNPSHHIQAQCTRRDIINKIKPWFQ